MLIIICKWRLQQNIKELVRQCWQPQQMVLIFDPVQQQQQKKGMGLNVKLFHASIFVMGWHWTSQITWSSCIPLIKSCFSSDQVLSNHLEINLVKSIFEIAVGSPCLRDGVGKFAASSVWSNHIIWLHGWAAPTLNLSPVFKYKSHQCTC